MARIPVSFIVGFGLVFGAAGAHAAVLEVSNDIRLLATAVGGQQFDDHGLNGTGNTFNRASTASVYPDSGTAFDGNSLASAHYSNALASGGGLVVSGTATSASSCVVACSVQATGDIDIVTYVRLDASETYVLTWNVTLTGATSDPLSAGFVNSFRLTIDQALPAGPTLFASGQIANSTAVDPTDKQAGSSGPLTLPVLSGSPYFRITADLISNSYAGDAATASSALNFSYSLVPLSQVPLPAAAWLLLSGIGALGAMSRRRNGKVVTAS